MILGVDFDNTVVSYDALFLSAAKDAGLVGRDADMSKTELRDLLRSRGEDNRFTELQAEVYGRRMAEASCFEGVTSFLRLCASAGITVFIISHKTRTPIAGPSCDLHEAAFRWLESHSFFSDKGGGLVREHVFFEPTKEAKLARIASCRCTHFVDDLPEILLADGFPANTSRILFDPARAYKPMPFIASVQTWGEMAALLGVKGDCLSVHSTVWANTGLVPCGDCHPLGAGANNRVYEGTLTNGAQIVIKRYQTPSNADRRDRFRTEQAFYEHAQRAVSGRIPVALAWDPSVRVGIFSRVQGQAKPSLGDALFRQCLEFLQALNVERERSAADKLGAASEACFSLAAHLDTVGRRVAALMDICVEDDIDREAAKFAQFQIAPLWAHIDFGVRACQKNGGFTRLLARSERIISPSDFGMHNALLVEGNKLVFIDFEYAGWDDPAKTVADFFSHPDMQPEASWRGDFIHGLSLLLPLASQEAFHERCRILHAVYQLKWICILLNEFNSNGYARRAYALGPAHAYQRKAGQLAKARTLLAKIIHP